MNKKLFEYISASPTQYHAAAHTAELLEAAGFERLCEGREWKIEGGKGYYVTRNGSSLIAFRVPQGDFGGFMMTAAHSDSPCFRIKENAELDDGEYVRLSAEKYGGMLCSSWLDRPLSIAGRVVVQTEKGIESRLVDLREPTAVIPNVAIHMNRNANDGFAYNPAVDMIPLYGGESEKNTLRARLAQAAGVQEDEILATDIMVYNPQECIEWNGFISAPRLDDLQCAFAALEAFVQAQPSGSMPVYCLFDNEEVGSQTKQGAASVFLSDVLDRVCISLGCGDYRAKLANSFLASCDNAHAVHPNHAEYMDKNHAVYMNKGVVIKYNANQRYATDAVSQAIFRRICGSAEVPVQMYANRADMPGGSTLGSIANTQVPVNTIDIGLAQLAMHSAYETAGAQDTQYLVNALKALYETAVCMESDGNYTVE